LNHVVEVQHVEKSSLQTEVDEGTDTFVDDSFFGHHALGINEEYPLHEVTHFLRPSHFGAHTPKLFTTADGECFNDVDQGAMGDCYFISSLSILGTRRDLLKLNVAVDSAHPSRGHYGFRFFKEGQWRVVEVDDRLPCNKDNSLVFAKCVDKNELWVST
jgi:hypothetical protein